MHTRWHHHLHGVRGFSLPCCHSLQGAHLNSSTATVHTHRAATLRDSSSSSSARNAGAHTNIQQNAYTERATQPLDSSRHTNVLQAMGVLTSVEPRSFQEVPSLSAQHFSARADAHCVPSPQPTHVPFPQQSLTAEQEETERPADSSSLHMEASTSSSDDSDGRVWDVSSGVHAWSSDVRVFGKKKIQQKARQQQQQQRRHQQQRRSGDGLSTRAGRSAKQSGRLTASTSSADLDSSNSLVSPPLSSRNSSHKSARSSSSSADAWAGKEALPSWADPGSEQPPWQQHPWFSNDDLGDLLLDYSQFSESDTEHSSPQQLQKKQQKQQKRQKGEPVDYSQFSDSDAERRSPQQPQKRQQKWQKGELGRKESRGAQPASAEMHLTYSIKAARSCQELQDLMALHGQSMNHVHVSVMLTRLVQLSSALPTPLPARALFHQHSAPAAPSHSPTPTHSPTHSQPQPTSHAKQASLKSQQVRRPERRPQNPLSPPLPPHPASTPQPWPSWQSPQQHPSLPQQQRSLPQQQQLQQFSASHVAAAEPQGAPPDSYNPGTATQQQQQHTSQSHRHHNLAHSQQGQHTHSWRPQTQQPLQQQQHPRQHQQHQQQQYGAASLPALPPPPPQAPPWPRPATQGQLVLMLARKAREQLEQMGFWELSASMACLVKLRAPLKKSFYIAFMEAAKRKFKRQGTYGRPSPQALVQLLWAVARCGMKGLRNDWAYMYLWAVEELWDQFDLRSLVRLLHGLACLKHTPPPPFLAKLLGCVQPLLPSASTLDLSNTIWALARLRQAPPPSFTHAWLSAAQPRVSEAGPLELPSMLWGLGRLGVQPPQQWMAAALARAAQLRPVLNGQGLSLTVYAAGLLRANPPPGWLHAMLTTASSRRFRGFGPQSMALLVYGACVLLGSVPPPGWLPAFHDALESMPQRFEPAGLELIREAFEVVGFIPRQPQLQPVRPSATTPLAASGAPAPTMQPVRPSPATPLHTHSHTATPHAGNSGPACDAPAPAGSTPHSAHPNLPSPRASLASGAGAGAGAGAGDDDGAGTPMGMGSSAADGQGVGGVGADPAAAPSHSCSGAGAGAAAADGVYVAGPRGPHAMPCAVDSTQQQQQQQHDRQALHDRQAGGHGLHQSYSSDTVVSQQQGVSSWSSGSSSLPTSSGSGSGLPTSEAYEPSSNGSGVGAGAEASSNGSYLDGRQGGVNGSSRQAEQDEEGERARQALLLWDVDRDGEWDDPGLAAAARVQEQRQHNQKRRHGTVQKPSRFG